MKPTLNCPSLAVAGALTPGSKRLISALSPQILSRQVTGRPDRDVSSRLPVTPYHRAQLKALRQAELAAWEAAGRLGEVEARAATQAVRLPAPVRNRAEGWLYGLLAAVCAGIIGYELWNAYQAAGNWRYFVQFVRQLLA